MPLARRFDLLAGTSIGGVLALALAFEIPMSRLVRLFNVQAMLEDRLGDRYLRL